MQFRYGEDGVDPSKAVRGKAIDMDDLFSEVLGDGYEDLLRFEQKDVGGDYGAMEKDEMEYTEEEVSEEYDGDDEMDYDGGGE